MGREGACEAGFYAAAALFIVLYPVVCHVSPLAGPAFPMADVDIDRVFQHVHRMIEIGNSEFVYERSRARAREYLRSVLLEGGHHEDAVVWHRFEWSEKHVNKQDIVTTTWTGINIVFWGNTTAVPSEQVRIFCAHYDTNRWGENRTEGAHDNLAAAAALVELAINVRRYQAQRSAEDAAFVQAPVMFVLLDHSVPGMLGSRVTTDHHRAHRDYERFAFAVNVDSVGFWSAVPLVQTLPYEHQGHVRITPAWLVHLLLQGAQESTGEGFSSYLARDGALRVGARTAVASVLAQAIRYHAVAVGARFDDGPFAWANIPAVTLTDMEVFFEENPNREGMRTAVDLLPVLEAEKVHALMRVLARFARATVEMRFPVPSPLAPSLAILKAVATSVRRWVFPGHDHYVTVGAFLIDGPVLLAAAVVVAVVAVRRVFLPLRDEVPARRSMHMHKAVFFHVVAAIVTLLHDPIFASLVVAASLPAMAAIAALVADLAVPHAVFDSHGDPVRMVAARPLSAVAVLCSACSSAALLTVELEVAGRCIAQRKGFALMPAYVAHAALLPMYYVALLVQYEGAGGKKRKRRTS